MAIECSWWLFPAIIMSGIGAPIVFVVSCIVEVLKNLLHLIGLG